MDIDLNTLDTLRIEQLRALWAEHMGRSKPPRQRRLLIRELAWRTQEKIHGGLDAQTRRLLQAAMRVAKASMKDRNTNGAGVPGTKRRRGPKRSSRLPSSTRLVREWHGRRHEVFVLDDGKSFRYQDRTYGSLSEIAREITGTRWSGPRFFGLATREGLHDKRASLDKKRRTGGDPA